MHTRTHANHALTHTGAHSHQASTCIIPMSPVCLGCHMLNSNPGSVYLMLLTDKPFGLYRCGRDNLLMYSDDLFIVNADDGKWPRDLFCSILANVKVISFSDNYTGSNIYLEMKINMSIVNRFMNMCFLFFSWRGTHYVNDMKFSFCLELQQLATARQFSNNC